MRKGSEGFGWFAMSGLGEDLAACAARSNVSRVKAGSTGVLGKESHGVRADERWSSGGLHELGNVVFR